MAASPYQNLPRKASVYSSSLSPDSLSSSFLSRLIRTHLPRLSSRDFDSSSSSSGESTPSHTRRWSSNSSFTGTPPPVYRSKASLVSDAEDDYFDALESSRLGARAGQESTLGEGLPDDFEIQSGIEWRYANQAISLYNLARQEGQSLAEPSGGIPSLTRQLYLHGTTYGLRGLPKQLSNEEIMSIWSSLPPAVRDIAAITTQSDSKASLSSRRSSLRYADALDHDRPPSVLHRVVAFFILQLFMLLQFLAPYMRLLAIYLASYERQNRVSERVLGQTMRAADGLVKFGNRVCDMNDGRVGQALGDAMVWWIRGVTGGIRQGIGSGLMALGVEGQGQDAMR
ncbi:hypothetical protein BT63DRAFT_419801 [Microthyrium microscopicum]|uniref:Uncharacterized protein n=1 Tax=Microthyrium microscopicum TaxID=703497 RepID=A0A6A6UQG6_9PEZI|nr:hypothetical protein BT63DRAFT_419801 [Microthyrium microscopicum]